MKKTGVGDNIFIGVIAMLGLAEVAHFASVFFGWSVSRCSVLFAVGCILLVLAGVALTVRNFRKRAEVPGTESGAGKTQRRKERELLQSLPFYVLFGILAVSQIAFICAGVYVFRNGDMMVETVGSFLVQDGAYRVNPLTGSPYTAGIPLRLEILGLPMFYSMLCYLTGLDPVVLVQRIVPVCVLLLSYLAFALLGKELFGEKRRERALFLVLVALLLWASTYQYGVAGFNLLCCGWRGVTIRNLVLLPWLFSLCMRKNYFGILLCLAAEVCLVWTLYGLGVCVLVAGGMLLAGWFAGGRKAGCVDVPKETAEIGRPGEEDAV